MGSRTPEGKVKDKLTKTLRAINAYYFFPVASPLYGKRGVPDVVACIEGRFVAFECKAGKNKATEIQVANLATIHDAGGIALICNDENVEDLVEMLHAPDIFGQLPLLSYMQKTKGYKL
jgi:hypothetical protein